MPFSLQVGYSDSIKYMFTIFMGHFIINITTLKSALESSYDKIFSKWPFTVWHHFLLKRGNKKEKPT